MSGGLTLAAAARFDAYLPTLDRAGEPGPGVTLRRARAAGVPTDDSVSSERYSQERFRPNQIAELRHRDTSKRESRRVVAQGDSPQCAEGITAARARAAAVIIESIGIPPHLSLPSFETRR